MSRPIEQLPPPWLPLTPIATALLVFFAYGVVAAALPVQLLNQTWQLSLIVSLIDNAPLALMALGLVHLHAWLKPDVNALQQRRHALSRLAVAASLGFLLLVPLQIQLTLGVLQSASVVQAERLAAIERDYRAIQAGLAGIDSRSELVQLLQQRGGPQLSAALLAQPLPLLRQRLLENLSATRLASIRRLHAAARDQAWGLLTSASRNVVCGLALALGFAGGASWRGSRFSLLQVWQMQLRSCSRWLRSRRLPWGRRARSETRQYLDSIAVAAPDKPSPTALSRGRTGQQPPSRTPGSAHPSAQPPQRRSE